MIETGLNTDVKYLDPILLDEKGRCGAHHAAKYQAVPLTQLRIWSSKNARYGYPTKELIAWLMKEIGSSKAIEIGAGQGDLGYHLGIPMSDNYCQQLDYVKAHYALMGQTPTSPPPDVERLDAIEAIEKYKPDVVVGSWITQKFYDESKELGGNMFGPEEEDIIKRATYIHIGNTGVHGVKRILKRPHLEFQFPWLVSRSGKQEDNIIYVWER